MLNLSTFLIMLKYDCVVCVRVRNIHIRMQNKTKQGCSYKGQGPGLQAKSWDLSMGLNLLPHTVQYSAVPIESEGNATENLTVPKTL